VDGHLDDLQAALDRPVVHLDLEAVAVAADTGQVEGFQGRAAPELEARGDIADAEPQQGADVAVGEAGQRLPAP
jgi:hypothetical protein